jgi:Tic22-like family
MKSLVRWGATIGVVGSTVAATFLSAVVPVVALPEQQIKAKLDEIPVWLITNGQGSPLSRQLPDNQGKKGGSMTLVYMSRQEAQKSIKELQSIKDKDPKKVEMFKSLQATTVSLGTIYQKLQQTKNQPDKLFFSFKPDDNEIKGATELMRTNGQDVKQLRSIPTFLVRFAPGKSYVPIQLGDKKEYIPVFTSKKDADALLNQVKPSSPTASIEVVDVDRILQTLQQKNDKGLEQIVFFPSPEAREYIRQVSNNATPKAPVAAPPQKK